jgi:hypothetical protein
MKNEENKEFIKSKNNIYIFIWLFLIMELAAFFIVAYFILSPQIQKERIQQENDLNTGLLYFSYLAVIIAVPLAYKFYDIKRKQAVKKTSIKQKAELYFITQLIMYSMFEFSAILTLIAFYVNKMYEPLYMFGIIFIALLLNKPSLKKFIQYPDKKEPISIPENENTETPKKKTEEKNNQ